jgi:hypothetical protein
MEACFFFLLLGIGEILQQFYAVLRRDSSVLGALLRLFLYSAELLLFDDAVRLSDLTAPPESDFSV